jgi:competence protein ComEA
MPSRRDSDAISPRALARVRPDASVGPGDVAGSGEVSGAERGRHRPLEIPRGPVFELPSSLRGARWAPSRSAALAVLVVVALVALVFGVRLWLAGSGGGDAIGVRSPEGAPVSGVSRGTSTLARASPTGSGAASPGPSSSGGAGAGAVGAGAGASGVLVVHVVGQVRAPGVYRMAGGSRVGDAVVAAGGATRAADLAAVNLARVLVDGEQVVVPRPGESVSAQGGAGPAAGTSGSSGGAGGPAPAGGKVSLNSADLSALDTLPGVGPVLAQRILDWRTEHGRFTSVEELGEVSGIGEKLLAQLTPKVTL